MVAEKVVEKMQHRDLNNNKRLDLAEFYQSLILSEIDGPTTPGSIQVLFDSMDADGSGAVSIYELQQWLDRTDARFRLKAAMLAHRINIGGKPGRLEESEPSEEEESEEDATADAPRSPAATLGSGSSERPKPLSSRQASRRVTRSRTFTPEALTEALVSGKTVKAALTVSAKQVEAMWVGRNVRPGRQALLR